MWRSSLTCGYVLQEVQKLQSHVCPCGGPQRHNYRHRDTATERYIGLHEDTTALGRNMDRCGFDNNRPLVFAQMV